MPDAFLASIAWHYMVFAKTGNGDIWRIWFGADGGPLMEKLISGQPEWAEPVRILEAVSVGRSRTIHTRLPGMDA